jgi:Fe-Mn family superoxide dismutase
MKHELPQLPFPKTALEPFMSAETLEYHHGKHHKAYVDKLNILIKGTEFENMSLQEIVVNSEPGPIFNNAGQAWNHTFLWNSLSPQKQEPQGELLKAIQRDFASVDEFKTKFQKAGAEAFGSGWVWLVRGDSGKLTIEATSNADNPLIAGKQPLLTCDLWEHAYYIDYRNERPRYLQEFCKIMNWQFAQENFLAKTNTAAA